MFDAKSRYAGVLVYVAEDWRGRLVPVVAVPDPPAEATLGFHYLREGERLDHLAHKYLGDPAAFWRICEANGVMLAEALSEQREIAIPAGKPR